MRPLEPLRASDPVGIFRVRVLKGLKVLAAERETTLTRICEELQMTEELVRQIRRTRRRNIYAGNRFMTPYGRHLADLLGEQILCSRVEQAKCQARRKILFKHTPQGSSLDRHQLRDIREKLGMTQEHMANLLGVTQPWYCLVETGVQKISATMQVNIKLNLPSYLDERAAELTLMKRYIQNAKF